MRELGMYDTDKSLVIFDESGHSPMDSETAEFMDLLISFIEKYR